MPVLCEVAPIHEADLGTEAELDAELERLQREFGAG